MSTDQQVGRTVHGLMWDRRITNRSMAGHLGIDETTMTRKLRGTRKWTLDEVLTLARVLDVPITDLLPEVTAAFPPQSDDAEVAVVIPFPRRAALAVAS